MGFIEIQCINTYVMDGCDILKRHAWSPEDKLFSAIWQTQACYRWSIQYTHAHKASCYFYDSEHISMLMY